MRTCLRCKSEFVVTTPNKIYCSKKCYMIGRHRKRTGKPVDLSFEKDSSCPVCDKEFSVTGKNFNKIYCSTACCGFSKKRKKLNFPINKNALIVLKTKNCLSCAKEFVQKLTTRNQKYCCKKCAANACHRRKKDLPLQLQMIKCNVCDKEFRQKRSNNGNYCSFRCKRLASTRKNQGNPVKGKLKHIWGSGHINAQGYKVISKIHPNARGRKKGVRGRGQILEHTWVMSNYIGRPLRKGETVHHKNGIRNDNRIENLELWSKSHPFGQRVEDKINWAKEFLESYGHTVVLKDEKK